MKHLIVCREYPPAPYPPGGIGTYVRHIGRLLAEAGETVHIVAQRWEGAPLRVSSSMDGNLVVHRVALNEPISTPYDNAAGDAGILRGLLGSDCPAQAFSWQVARIAERLVHTERIDLIEAPEWEAPLYYFQLRRALDLGPRRQPPCLIHLHSPSELIFQHNEWDQTLTDFLPLCRMEEYSVRAADALVCPSRYLARGAERLFGLSQDIVPVIPYPCGDSPLLERSPDIWERDVIVYVGRLELRKGAAEWVDAAVEVASSHPTVKFEFAGSATSLNGGAGPSVQEYLNRRIPRALKARFRFHGSLRRGELLKLLAGAPAAVVPSRWENLPYSCIEAMATGLPVLVSPAGGMVELVNEGESGWVAPDATSAGLAAALRRLLEAPPQKRAAMGKEAAKTIRRICDNQSVLARHLQFRERIAKIPPERSLDVPVHSSHRPTDGAQRASRGETARSGMGVVVNCFDRADLLAGCLKAIASQKQPPKVAALVLCERLRAKLAEEMPELPWPTLYASESSGGTAREIGATHLLFTEPTLRGIVFLDESVRLDPEYLSTVESVFDREPAVGMFSSFMRYSEKVDELDASPCAPSLPALSRREDLPCVAVRAEVLLAEAGRSPALSETIRSDMRLGEGWAALTYPAVLVELAPKASGGTGAGHQSPKRYSAIALAQHGSPRMAWNWFRAGSLAEKIQWISRAARRPATVAQWLAWQVRNIGGRAR